MTDDPDELARRSAAAMWSRDAASQALGMRIAEVAPGRAVLAMAVRPDMVNGFDLAHGGIVAALADSAFAFACNSRGTMTVAAGFDVTFLQPARVGDELVATAQERARSGRSGVYDVTVRVGQTVVAELRGRSRSMGRPVEASQRPRPLEPLEPLEP